MTDGLQELIKKAERIRMSAEHQEEQRRSFAFGNTRIENDLITWEIVAREAEKLKQG